MATRRTSSPARHQPHRAADQSGPAPRRASRVRFTTATLRDAYAEMGLKYEEQGSQLAKAIAGLNAELVNRARIESDLRESRERLSVVIRTAAEGIITINQHGVIDSFNPAAERMFGYRAKEVLGRNIGTLMPAPYRAKHDTYLSTYITTGVKKVIGIGREVVGLRKNGTTFPMGLAVGEGTDGDGPVFTGIVRDLTERKESEARLRTTERLASIGTLAAGLGHDINHVLLPLRAHLNALRSLAAPPASSKHLGEIAKSLTYLQQLADGLHFLALDPECDADSRGGGTSTDLRQWWSQAGTLLSKALPKRARVTASLPANLPKVNVPAHRLTQAMLNVMVNAGEALPAASSRNRRPGSIRLWARSDPASKTIHLGVTDNGRGMTEEVRRRALDIFFTTKPRGLGTGLGLSLVNQVATTAGGRVEIESTLGHGTTIVMVLPTVAPKTTTAPAKTAAISVGDGRASALIRHMLEAGMARILTKPAAGRAFIRVVDPAQSRIIDLSKWRASRPDGRLVLFGAPDQATAPQWRALRPTIISRRNDFTALRKALGEALSGD